MSLNLKFRPLRRIHKPRNPQADESMYDTTIASHLLLSERVNSPTEAIYDRGEISLVGLGCFIDILLKHIAMELKTYAVSKFLIKRQT